MPRQRFHYTRRQFLGQATVAAAGLALSHRKVFPATATHPLSPNDRPGVALIGCGGMGRADARLSKDFCEILAVCDVDRNRLAEAKQEWPGADTYTDFRKVLERPDIHAVICGTQDHWHALITIAAMKAGKDVYCEKPLTLTIEEGQRIVRVSRETGRLVQTGSQQRSDRNFRHACELVRNGRIGKVHQVTTILPAGPRRGPFAASPVPPELDWDLWLGPREAVPYVKEKCHGTFRYWYDYSGGTMTDWGAHHNDIALWGLGLERSGPVEIEGQAQVEMIPGGFTAASEYVIHYRYANGVRHVCRSTNANNPSGGRQEGATDQLEHGVLFEGSGGWIFVTRGKIEAQSPELLTQELPASAERLYVSDNHRGNFFECLRTRKPPICEAEIGHRSASVCHLGVIAMRLGRKLEWDPEREVVRNDREANDWLRRPMRAPWTWDRI